MSYPTLVMFNSQIFYEFLRNRYSLLCSSEWILILIWKFALDFLSDINFKQHTNEILFLYDNSDGNDVERAANERIEMK